MNKLVNWLENTCGCHGVRPCRVTIGSESWEAAYYKQTLTYGLCDATRWGAKLPTDTYTRETIYCVGKLPKCYKHNRTNRVCFTPLWSGHDWYIAGYLPEATDAERMERYHPLGVDFMLSPWDIPNTKIDDFESTPYKRVPMQVEFFVALGKVTS